jgi:hypothetical protein
MPAQLGRRERIEELLPKFTEGGFAEVWQCSKALGYRVRHNTSNRLVNIAACLPVIIKSILRPGARAFCVNDWAVSHLDLCLNGREH